MRVSLAEAGLHETDPAVGTGAHTRAKSRICSCLLLHRLRSPTAQDSGMAATAVPVSSAAAGMQVTPEP